MRRFLTTGRTGEPRKFPSPRILRNSGAIRIVVNGTALCTFYFALEEGGVIDGKIDGNSARWINHSCAPNCEAEEVDGRVYIHALRDIGEQEELFYDYGLVIDARLTKKLKREYACHCGAATCRGTLLATSEDDEGKKKKKAKKGGKDKKKKK